MKPINSRAKGQRAEREFRDLLRAEGWNDARRGQQFRGGVDSPDIVCPSLDGFRIEVKHQERVNLAQWMAQIERDAGAEKTPILAMRRNGLPFVISMRAETFFRLLSAYMEKNG